MTADPIRSQPQWDHRGHRDSPSHSSTSPPLLLPGPHSTLRRLPLPLGPPFSGLSRHICSLQLQPNPPDTPISPSTHQIGGLRQLQGHKKLLKFWLSSFQGSPNPTACITQGGGDRRDRGHPSRGAREGPGSGQLGRGHASKELRKARPAPLLTREPAACRGEVPGRPAARWQQAALSGFGGGQSQE